MAKATTIRPAEQDARRPLLNPPPTDPVRRARWIAIQAGGGASHIGRLLGRSRGEGVRRWYVDLDPTPEEARQLVEWCNHEVTLQQILPGAFAGLTAKALGYKPA